MVLVRRLIVQGTVALAMLVPAEAVRGVARSHFAESGDLGAYVTAYRSTLPGQDSNRYLQPGEGDVALIVGATRLALAGDFEAAAAGLDGLGYDLVVFDDTTGGHAHLMLRERSPCGRCWGLYLLSGSPTARNVLVEVPHPIWDQYSPELGIDAYLRLDASAFLMAGTHQPLELLMSSQQDRGRGDLVDVAHLEAHDAILDVVDDPYAVVAGDRPDPLDQLDEAMALPVQGDRAAFLELQLDLLGLVRRALGRRDELEDVPPGRLREVLDRPSLR